MTRVADKDRDVYGSWCVAVVNATRHALRSNSLMSEAEYTIVMKVLENLNELDPAAGEVRQAKVIVR